MHLHLSPDAAVATLTLGTALIYWELNRPGTILPGALGLLAALFATASLLQSKPQPVGVVLLATAAGTLAVGLRRTPPPVVSAAATLALILGFFTLFRPTANGVHIMTSMLCGLVLGTGTSILATIARRARRNKGSARGNKRLD